jgi:hypothetical protein
MLEMKSGCSTCDQSTTKPFPPPYELVSRIDGLSARLRGRLLGSPTGWIPPFTTSR